MQHPPRCGRGGPKDGSSKEEIEVGSSKKDSRSKAACGSKDMCGSKTMKENKESAKTKAKDVAFIVLQEYESNELS